MDTEASKSPEPEPIIEDSHPVQEPEYEPKPQEKPPEMEAEAQAQG